MNEMNKVRENALSQFLGVAKANLAAKIKAEFDAGIQWPEGTAVISDPHGTPFFEAMKMAGWLPKLARSGCLAESRFCEHCKGASSRHRFQQNGIETEICINCNN